jgi:hypothetical protein
VRLEAEELCVGGRETGRRRPETKEAERAWRLVAGGGGNGPPPLRINTGLSRAFSGPTSYFCLLNSGSDLEVVVMKERPI